MAEANTTPTYGYHKTKEPQVFDLAEGESLPKGWRDSPAAFDQPETPEAPEAPAPDAN